MELILADSVVVGGSYKIENFDTYKRNLESLLKPLNGLVVDESNLVKTKENIAKLNNLTKTLNERRLHSERQFMQPFNDGKEQVNQLIEIVTKVLTPLKQQVNDFVLSYQNAKITQIKEIFDRLVNSNFVNLDLVFTDKWLNKTYSLEKIEQDIKDIAVKINADVEVLKHYSTSIDKRYELLAKYRETLDLSKTIEWLQLSEKNKNEIRNLFKDIDDNEPHCECDFKVTAPKTRIKELVTYCNSNKIKIELKESE